MHGQLRGIDRADGAGLLEAILEGCARSQGSTPWQTQVMALGAFCSSRIFLWTWSPIAAIKRPAV
jgi:hypothetical protein